MIHVDRETVAAPAILSSDAAREAREAAAAFFRLRKKTRAQRAFEFDPAIYAADDVREALHALFRGKCAYCESPLDAAALIVDQFRPRAGALDLEGGISPPHYWWLAYEWENLYPCCAECSGMKGSRFPVEGARARRGRTDKALLLDPGADNPEEHLVFLDDGTVASNGDRGRITIDVLGLNRSALVAGRAAALEQVRGEWEGLLDEIKKTGPGPSPTDLEALTDSAFPFAALRRQFVKEWAYSERGTVDEFLGSAPEGPDSVEEVAAETPVVDDATKREAKASFDARQVAQEAYSVAQEAVGEEYFGKTRMIERIVIRNFRVIEDLTLDFPPPTKAERAAWLTLLGENGCGKSSVLQAVALALVGQEYRNRLGVDGSLIVRRGEESASVEVYLTGSPEPVTLRCTADAPRLGGEPEEPKVLLLGYGATRLLPRGGALQQTESSFARVDNLFNPFVPLADVTPWLLGLDAETFDTVARGLKSLLVLDEEDRLIPNRSAGRIEVEAFGTTVSLDQLSDGYQSVLALAADIMIVMSSRWSAIEAAEGIVLIDELGAHLHPRWRMRIVKSLRDVFPRLQFLVSTHDPLCLRGLGNGEVAVMRRTIDDAIVAVTDLPPVEGLRVDQLLTSEHFGLNSATDPEVDALFAEYYLLKAKGRLTAAERERHAELEEALADRDKLGTTRRDRLVLEAADEFLAREQQLGDGGERRQLRDETKQKIVDLWERATGGEAL